MQVKKAAELLGLDNKEIVTEVESRRDEFEAKGYKIAKKLNATSSLEDDLVRDIMANIDIRRQESAVAEKEAEGRRKREEDERRRAAGDIQRAQEEAERRAKSEAARLHAEQELARRQAELRAQEEAAARKAAAEAEAAAQRDAEERAAKKAADAATAASKAAPKVGAEPTVVAAAPAAPVAEVRAPAAPPASTAPRTAPPTAGAPPPRAGAPQAPRAPISRPGFPNPAGDRGGAPGQPGAYNRDAQRPGGDFRPREGQPQQRPGAPGAAPYNRDAQRPGERPRTDMRPPGPGGPRQDFRGGPRPGGTPTSRGPGGSFQSRGPGGPGGVGGAFSRGPGGPGRGPGGPGGARGPGGPGGFREGQRPGGGPRGPARTSDVQNFVDQGMQSDVTDDFKRTQVRRAKPDKTGKVPTERTDTDENKPRKAARPGEDDAKKRIRPTQIYNVDAVNNERRGKPRKKQPGERREMIPQKIEPKSIRFSGDFTVGEFADRTGIPIGDVMKKLFLMGDMLTINQLLDPDKAEDLAVEFDVEIRIEREGDEIDVAEYGEEDNPEDMLPRAPVVTIMGHVDHGKTSLLDRIRKEDVAAGEFGGITQHIGAYLVATPKGDIVFLDTPGHEAFTEMRSRGANVTDLVVLVVAANDGVMPQTVEAINHAKAAGVPILVAINKVDVVGSNPERVKQELMKYELVPEEYGGTTIMLPVSAVTGQGVDTLLEYIALQTEILELRANPNRSATGTIIESHVDPARGAIATLLVERGTLNIGDVFVCGTEYGRVRAMRDDRDHELEHAGPARPVEILGLRGSPVAGEKFFVLPTESEARDIAERRMARRKTRRAIQKQHISLENLADRMTESDVMSLNLIVKGDVQGSVEAINGALLKIKSDKVLIRILHYAVGAVSVSDVQLADAADAIILAFNVSTDPASKTMAEDSGVDIRSYQIIYALLEDIEKAMVGMLAPEFEEKEEGRATVKQVFKVSKVGSVAGCYVEEGAVALAHQARLIRQGTIVWRGKIKSLRRVKDEAKQVMSGLECGIGLENFNDVKEGDTIETFSLLQKSPTLMGAPAGASSR
ncbi:hypothetical protein BH09SUM1_BH09SUM1_10480 [soil metagenome]